MNKTRSMAFAGILSALAIALTYIEIPYPLFPWLKFDLSELVIMIGVEILAFPLVLLMIVIKTLGYFLTGSATPFFIGEITAFLSALIFAICFKLTKRFKLSVRLITIVIVFTIIMTMFNFFIATPIYFTQTLDFTNVYQASYEITIFSNPFVIDSIYKYFIAILIMYVPFNIIKSVLIVIIYGLIYKPIIRYFKKAL